MKTKRKPQRCAQLLALAIMTGTCFFSSCSPEENQDSQHFLYASDKENGNTDGTTNNATDAQIEALIQSYQ